MVAVIVGPWIPDGPAHAAPRVIDPEPIDEPEEPPFTPPPGGFDWKVPNRFNVWRWNDVRDSTPAHGGLPETYDPAYVFPTQFPMDFEGCPSQSELDLARRGQPTAFSYTWDVAGQTTTVRTCLHRHVFAAEGSYPARLTITDGAIVLGDHAQTVRVRDFLIVSLGDSYASGEGNPDVPQIPSAIYPFVDQQVDWLDDRCHRSFWAGPTQAARLLEEADDKTSVTYLSFSCSGATIAAETFRNGDPLDPYERVGVSAGSGVLGDYAGVAPPGNPPDFSNRVPSQIEQLRRAIGNRRVDALMISAGGNDIGFGPVATVCVLYGLDCPSTPVASHVPGVETPLRDRFAADLADLPRKYALLASALAGLGIEPGRVYLTEYPDPATDLNGNTCGYVLEDVFPAAVLTPLHPAIVGGEVEWARTTVLRGLNDAITTAAARHGWKHVGGIEAGFIGHGYCSRESWIRRAADSTLLQGPYPTLFNDSTSGTLHPTFLGHVVYRNVLLAALRADLDLGAGPGAPPASADSAPPAFAATWTKDAVTSRAGDSGWLLGPAVLTVDAVAASMDAAGRPIDNALTTIGLAVDGVPGCPDNGLLCTAQLRDARSHRWTFEATAEGVYRIEVIAGDRRGRTERSLQEMKVDLTDPTVTFPPAITSAGPPRADWYRGPVQVTFEAADAPTGSGLKGVEYRLDGAGSLAADTGDPITVTGEGPRTLEYRAVDLAGRTSPWQTFLIAVDAGAPVITCGKADGLWHAVNISITCTAVDGGSGLANPADASFTLSTSVAAGAETADAATGTRSVCDAAGNCATAGPIGGNKIDRKPPVLVVPGALTVNATGPAGAAVTYSATASDGSGPASVDCRPASGTVIPVGTTTVACTATDASANAARASFVVTVKGAIEQIIDLIEATTRVMLTPDVRAQLAGTLDRALAEVRNQTSACRTLDAYIAAVRAQNDRRISAAAAAPLIADATRIKAVLGCSS